jgi:hypothetical protein
MPTDSSVLCAHCGKYLPRRLEREHRKLAASPYVSPPLVPTFPSQLCCVIDVDSDDDNDIPNLPADNIEATIDISDQVDEYIAPDDIDVVDEDGEDLFDEDHLHDNTVPFSMHFDSLRDHWRHMFEPGDSDSDDNSNDELPYERLEDSDDESDGGFIDWNAIEVGSGLSAWDQLGESYEKEAAAIGRHINLS